MWRSTQSTSSAEVRIGNASRISRLVTMMFQVKIGSRNIVMPGARSVITVVTMLTAPRMVPRPASASPMIHRSVPAPGEFSSLFSGAYSVQPASAAPPGVMKPENAVMPPNRNSQ
jgi:hypothetical protein